MRMLVLLLCLFFPAVLFAQSGTETKLSPYEENRYGGELWNMPREPYQSQYQADRFKARVYDLPESTVQERFQSQKQWEAGQRDVSERAATPYSPPGK